MKVSIVTTHLLGTGHLSRAISLANGLAARGHQATILSGGLPAPHLDPGGATILQLPPVKSDGLNFTALLTSAGDPVDEAYLRERRQCLLNAVADPAPDVVITELYPFGRRVLRAEFDAMLDLVRGLPARPLVLSSIRDILAPPSSAKRAEWTEERLASAYDGVLVHADPRLVRLDDSWPVSERVERLLSYTGFVAPALPPASANGDGASEILVSAGGGPVGQALFEAAIGAAGTGRVQRPLRLLVGGGDDRRRALADMASGHRHVLVEAPRRDYREMLQRAALSVSQAGYNTLLDVAMSGVRAVVAPFSEGGETEQSDRARAYGERLGLEVVAEDELSPERLAQAIERALGKPPPEPAGIAVDGAVESALIIERLVRERAA